MLNKNEERALFDEKGIELIHQETEIKLLFGIGGVMFIIGCLIYFAYKKKCIKSEYESLV